MPAKLGLALLLLVFALTACGTAHAHPSAHAAPKTLAPTTPAAYKTQLVDTHGIELAVPTAWRLNRQQCGTPTANTVLWLENGVTLCAIRRKPALSVVEFGGYWYPRHATRITIDGAEALRWDTGNAAELNFPHRGITVTVFSPHRALVRQILDSVRVVRVNTDGCPTRPAPSYRLGLRPRAAKRFIPAGAIQLVGCDYDGHWLDHSSRVGRQAAQRLAGALNNAPYGFSRAPRGTIARSECVPSWRSFVVARFEYAKRPPVTVTAHLDGCARLGASNGKWGVQMSRAWVDTFATDTAYAGSFSDRWG